MRRGAGDNGGGEKGRRVKRAGDVCFFHISTGLLDIGMIILYFSSNGKIDEQD